MPNRRAHEFIGGIATPADAFASGYVPDDVIAADRAVAKAEQRQSRWIWAAAAAIGIAAAVRAFK